MKHDLKKEIVIPAGIKAAKRGNHLQLQGPTGEVEQDFFHPLVQVAVAGDKIIVTAKKSTKREKTMVGSFVAHLRNMVRGVQELHIYKLKICSGHFPMSVSVQGNEFVVKNFLGESVPRRISVVPNVTVKVNDKEVLISSPDKAAAGQMAARVEGLCRITNRDLRIFMDGIWLTDKAGKMV